MKVSALPPGIRGVSFFQKVRSRQLSANESAISSGEMLLVLFTVALVRWVASYCFYLYDDAFITFRFVENLVRGDGFVYNVGERVQGISTPLWGLILSIPALMDFSLDWSARLLALTAELLCTLLFVRHLSTLHGRTAALGAGFLFAGDLYLAKTAMGGMESPLFLLMTVSATLLALRKKYFHAAVLAAFSVFVRPEGALFAVSLIAFIIIETKRLPAIAVIVGAAIVGIGASSQFFYYGDWIPQSVQGKAALPGAPLDVFTLALFPVRDPLQFVLTISALFGMKTAWKRSAFVRAYGIWCGALVAAWIVTGAHLWTWYCVPVWFFKIVVTAVAIPSWFEKQVFNRLLIRAFHPAALTVIILTGWTVVALYLGSDRMEKHVYSKIREWAKTDNFRGARVFAVDFGALGYYSGMTVLDEPGLVWPEAISLYGHDMRAILLAERPEYAYISVNRAHIEAMRTTELASLYTPLWRASLWGETDISPSTAELVTGWAPDFMMFARRDIRDKE